MTDKSSPNSRAYFLALEIIRLLVELEVSHSAQILRVQLVLRCHHQQKTNQWKVTRVKKVIVTDIAAQREAPRHLASEVSENTCWSVPIRDILRPRNNFEVSFMPNTCPHFVSSLMENHLTHSFGLRAN